MSSEQSSFIPPLNNVRGDGPDCSISSLSAESLAINSLIASMKMSDARHEQIYTLNKEILSKCTTLSIKLRICANLEECKMLIADIAAQIAASPFFQPPTVHTELNSFTSAIEKFVTCRLLCSFFETGRLLLLSDVQPCSDEEYLGGCIAMGHELLEYCVGRAAVADLTTIKYCHLLVTQLSDALNQFEFRNSPLRRKYDSLKYVVKKLTDIIYELGLALDLSACRTAGASGAAPTSVVGEESTPRKKARATEDDAWQPNAEVELELVSKTLFEEIRSRLDAYDRKREELIKATRDVQKLAKQGIYAVHRDMGKPFPKFDEATSKFKEGNKLLVGLFDLIVASHPPLRQGSFSAAIEELLEGILALHWCQQRQLLSKADCEARINACRACGLGCESATPMETMAPLTVTDVEYFGALSDLTGELGRIAVLQAMKRDVSCVEAILGTDTAVAQLLVRVSCEGSGGGGRGGMGKKVDAVLANRKKVMELRYDMACLALSGGVRASTIGVGDASELGAGTGSDDA